MSFEALRQEYEARRARALAMGGSQRLARRHAAGWLDARQRIAPLLDANRFIESNRHRLRPTRYRPTSAARLAHLLLRRSTP
jgi:acetyl-CoA carboxylase carboxyltransferase component